MKHLLNNLIRSAAMAALVTGTATLALSAEKSAGGNSIEASGTAPAGNARAYPIHGTIGTADPAAKTVSLTGKKAVRLLHVDSATQLSRDGKVIAIADLQTGDYLKGLVCKTEGHETLVKASVGEKPAPQSRSQRRTTKTAMNEKSVGN